MKKKKKINNNKVCWRHLDPSTFLRAFVKFINTIYLIDQFAYWKLK